MSVLQSVIEAASSGQVGLLQALLEKEGAPPAEKIFRKKDDEGRTAFHWACTEGRLDAAKFIFESAAGEGDDADAARTQLLRNQDDTGRTPLISACSVGNVPVAQFLLEAKADANQRTNNGQMAIHYHKGHLAILELLIPKTTNIDRKDKYGGTALSRAVAKGSTVMESVQMLVEAKADVNIVDSAKDTLLHIAASNKDDAMVRCDLPPELTVNRISVVFSDSIYIWCSSLRLPRNLCVECKTNSQKKKSNTTCRRLLHLQAKYLLSQGVDREALNEDGKKAEQLRGVR